MNDDYLEAFVRESEESVVELNNSLLALEEDPEDGAAMETIFRTAHTLKGNFAAMGFEAASDLAHAIEDLLDEMREDELAVTADRMDLVFEGVDRIEDALEEIEASGSVETDTAETEEAIRAAIAAADGDGDPAPGDGAAPDATGDPDAAEGGDLDRRAAEALDAVDADLSGVDPLVHVEADLEDSEMPGVDGMLFVEAAQEALQVVATVPDPEAVSEGDHDGTVDVFVAGEAPGAVEETVADIGGVEEAAATDVTAAVGAGAAAGDAPADAGGTGGPTDDGTAAAAEADGDATEEPKAGSPAGDEVEEADEESGGFDFESSGEEAKSDTGGEEIETGDEGPGGAEADEREEAVKSVRVDVDQLDELYNLVEQLVTSRIKLRRSVEDGDVASAAETLDELDKVTSSLQGTVMDMRLIPLSKVVNTFPRMVRDIAREQGKEIDFAMAGTDVELDRTILEEISDPLMHILRNAADHGIEPPAEREAAGKPREGTVRLRASRERDHVTIEVEDDGAGLEADELREKAVEEGVHTPGELEEMADDDVYDLIFHPGFSTAEEVTDVSGRGVGMDVVSSTVSRLDGSVDVDSDPGEGTTVTLRLPVSVAIVRVLFIDVDGREYGIPVKAVDEITGTDDVGVANGQEILEHEDELYPVLRLGEALDVPDTGEAAADGGQRATASGSGGGDGMLVRIRPSERAVALRCDAVTRQEEVVIKPLEGALSNTPGLGGTAVVGDGNVVPILDVETL